MKDATSQIRFATRRAKSDVANKLVSMFLHELSRRVSVKWRINVDGEEYEEVVRQTFGNRCPYCLHTLAVSEAVVEHLDGMNRYRAGLHVAGNVLIACKRCNSEKRRDDSLRVLSLAASGWESFLSHDRDRCAESCLTCRYRLGIWANEVERKQRLNENLLRIRAFRSRFPEFEAILPTVRETLPALLTKFYSDCQRFAQTEMDSLFERLEQVSPTGFQGRKEDLGQTTGIPGLPNPESP